MYINFYILPINSLIEFEIVCFSVSKVLGNSPLFSKGGFLNYNSNILISF